MDSVTTPIPDTFKKVIVDFISSFIASFPEYKDGIYKVLDMQEYTDIEFVDKTRSNPFPDECIKNMSEKNVSVLFEHCRRVYPERFFDILYQNEVIFSADPAVSNNVCVDFLPNVDFRMVWNMADVTDTTKDHLWKHLQLVTFTIVGSISRDNLSFGDTARMFEAIDETELKSKLEETMAGIQALFEGRSDADGDDTFNVDAHDANGAGQNQNQNAHDNDNGGSGGSSGKSAFPNAESIHEHLSGLLDGKIGALAKEIAEETVSELNIDVSNETSVSGVFQKLIKNPGKLTGIIKKVGEKLDNKMKSGDLKESELFKEASDFMAKMKSSGGVGGKGGNGMADIAQLFKAMNLNPGAAAGINSKSKLNLNAMQSELNRNMKMALTRERMQKKLEEKRAAEEAVVSAASDPAKMRQSVYQPEHAEKNEKSMRVPMAAPVNTESSGKTGYEPEAFGPTTTSSKNKKHKHKK